MSLPPQISSTLDSISALPGISHTELDRTGLEDVNISDLSLPGPSGSLPAALIRQAGGGKPNQLLLVLSFQVEPTLLGHRSLELLASVVRDWARSGETMQLRVDALPVAFGENVQTGTLQFRIEWIWDLRF